MIDEQDEIEPDAGAGPALCIRLDLLKPFASEPDAGLTFSDMQAVFGADLHITQQILRVLRDAQLIFRPAPARGAKPVYLLEKALVKLLVGRRPQRLTREKALACAAQAVEAVAAHNAASTLARVTGIEFGPALLDLQVTVHESVAVQITVAVKRSRYLVRDIADLLRRLRHVGNGVLRDSVVLMIE